MIDILRFINDAPANYILAGYAVAVIIIAALVCGSIIKTSRNRKKVNRLSNELDDSRRENSDLFQKLDDSKKENFELLHKNEENQRRLENEIEQRATASARAEKLEQDFKELSEKFQKLDEYKNELKEKEAALEVKLQEAKNTEEKSRKLYDEIEKSLKDTFTSISSQVIEKSNSSFLELAAESFKNQFGAARNEIEKRQEGIANLVDPIKESLKNVGIELQKMDKDRHGQYMSLKQQIESMAQLNNSLKLETRNLTQALRKPQVTGHWGEFQLKRVCELAGMLDHCDFFEQQSTDGEDCRYRPDLIVSLPGEKKIIVDAKAPIKSYLKSIEAETEEKRNECLEKHARAVRSRIAELKQKAYWTQFEDTPEFVIMFLPGEAFYQAALSQDPSLIEMGFESRVLLTSPTSLLALLRAAAYGWQQEKIAQNARYIQQLGKELCERITILSVHFSKLGRQLNTAINTYNQTLGSFDSRVLVTARKFSELGVAGFGETKDMKQIVTIAREPQEEAN